MFAALSKEFVEKAVHILISRFMLLSQSDLGNWVADPEEWINVESAEKDHYEYELRVRLTCFW